MDDLVVPTPRTVASPWRDVYVRDGGTIVPMLPGLGTIRMIWTTQVRFVESGLISFQIGRHEEPASRIGS